jgi:hypothetical protein
MRNSGLPMDIYELSLDVSILLINDFSVVVHDAADV